MLTRIQVTRHAVETRVKGSTKPSLSDQNVILVIVVGGMNGIEVLEAQEALSESGRADVEVFLGGTTFLTPADMLDKESGPSRWEI
ncbi:putative sec1-like protein [Helianthus anomalus]